MEMFAPEYQPWTGGGKHFSFLNQANVAERNFYVFCKALEPLLSSDEKALAKLTEIRDDFPAVIQMYMTKMWASKLRCDSYDATLIKELVTLMQQTSVDYTIFFRELSSIPDDIEALKKSFYHDISDKCHTT